MKGTENKLDTFEIRRLVEQSIENYKTGNLYRLLKNEDLDNIISVLIDYANSSQTSYTELNSLREKIKELNNKSGQIVRCLKILPNQRVLAKLGPIVEELMISPNIDINKLYPGCEMLVIGSQDGRLVADIRENIITEGRFAKVVRKLDDKRVIIEDSGQQIIMRTISNVNCDVGDEVRCDFESLMVVELIKREDTSVFSINDLPQTTFKDVKGLDDEIKFIKERIIYPSLYKEKFQQYGIKPIRGCIMHGPSGCGKTFIAGAIFNEMLKIKDIKKQKGFFIINGPELLNKWAGQTEESIRKLFKEARKVAKENKIPSIIFWDEIESITSKRKDSAAYTPEKTVVPTLLTELQGLNGDNDVILIGASNRPDLIDPALMRPGRLGDIILEIPRPNDEGGKEILASYINKKSNILEILINDGLIDKIISHIYNNKNPLARGLDKMGKTINIMRQEIVNGALFAQIGDELLRKICMAEIYNTDPPTIKDSIILVDDILLKQIGVLDSGIKNGFEQNIKDIIIDVSLNG